MDLKFKLTQRVVVPGTDRTLQGIVASRTEFVDPTVQPVYRVRWLQDDLSVIERDFDQDVLLEAQGETPLVAKREIVVSVQNGTTPFPLMDRALEKAVRKAVKKSKKKTKKRSRKKSKSRR